MRVGHSVGFIRLFINYERLFCGSDINSDYHDLVNNITDANFFAGLETRQDISLSCGFQGVSKFALNITRIKEPLKNSF
jgi:hypothetical protein